MESQGLLRVVALHAALCALEKQGAGVPTPPAFLDLSRELEAFTPKSLHYVLQDLFGASDWPEIKVVGVPNGTDA